MEATASTPNVLSFRPAVSFKNQEFDRDSLQKDGPHRSLFESVWENSLVGMRLTNDQGLVVSVNKMFCAIVGKSEEELIGQPFTAIYSEHENYEKLAGTYRKRFERCEFSTFMERKMTLWSGKVVALEVQSSFVESDEGEKLLLTIFRDVTDRREAEDALRESETKYRNLFANSIQPMFQSSVDGKLLNANRALLKLLGYDSFLELADINMTALYVNPEVRNEIKQILETKGYLSNVEIQLKRKNGKIITVVEYSRAIRDVNGKLVGFEGILEDVTARKAMEQKLNQYVVALETSQKALAQLNAEKDKLFSVLSHDLRSPFGSILGFCDILLKEDEQLSKEERMQFVSFVREAAQDQLSLVNKLLEWSRLESGRMKMEMKEVDLGQIAQKSIHSLLGLSKKNNVRLSSHLPEGLVIRGDHDMLQDVFTNLIGNALKFTRKAGSISIGLARQSGNELTIAIRDTGIGIPEADMSKLFRVEEKYTRRGLSGEKGTGLGLPVCAEIMQKHGGSIRAESEQNKGTTFFLTFPSGASKEGLNVLIVDDEDGVRVLHARYVKRFLPEANILYASNGQEGHEVALKHRPHAIVTDYAMPVMDGFEMLRGLKKDPCTQNIPVFVITGEDSKASREAMTLSGATCIFSKPVVPEHFGEELKKVVCASS